MNVNQLHGFEVPGRYYRDLLHLMVRDARSLYAYWEVSDRRRWMASRHFQCDWSVMPKVLRVYNVSDVYFNGSNAHRCFDIETTPESDNWYISVEAGAAYLADFGTYTLERQFIPLIRSNCVRTPRDTTAGQDQPLAAVVYEAAEGWTPGARIPQRHFENFSVYPALPSQ